MTAAAEHNEAHATDTRARHQLVGAEVPRRQRPHPSEVEHPSHIATDAVGRSAQAGEMFADRALC